MPSQFPFASTTTPSPALPGPLRRTQRRRIGILTSAMASACALIFATTAAATGHPTPAASDKTCALADFPEADALVRVPFEIIDGRIYVQASVNGRGPLRFAVDTGASGMARADSSLVASLGLTHGATSTTSDAVKTATVETTRLDSLQLGGLARNGLDVIARDYNSRNAPGAEFSGIIAREFFADGLLVIDYPRKTLSFARSHALSPGEPGVLGYERAFRIPVSIGTLQTTGNLDTGANVSFVLPQALYEKVAATALQQQGRARLTNGEIDIQRATVLGPFQVGGLSLSNVDVRVSQKFPELLVGAHALQDAVVLIDQRSHAVAICRGRP